MVLDCGEKPGQFLFFVSQYASDPRCLARRQRAFRALVAIAMISGKGINLDSARLMRSAGLQSGEAPSTAGNFTKGA